VDLSGKCGSHRCDVPRVLDSCFPSLGWLDHRSTVALNRFAISTCCSEKYDVHSPLRRALHFVAEDICDEAITSGIVLLASGASRLSLRSTRCAGFGLDPPSGEPRTRTEVMASKLCLWAPTEFSDSRMSNQLTRTDALL
jgi:hypothetical protein